MKIRVEISPSQRRSLLLALAIAVVLCLMCTLTYFRYGSPTRTFTPADIPGMLKTTWVLSGAQEGREGYEAIKVTGDKTMEYTRVINGAAVTETGKISYNSRTGALKLTFADKTEHETALAASLSFGAIGEMPVMGYLAYPNASPEFSSELVSLYAADGREFFINRSIIAPLFEFVLLCVSLVLCVLLYKNIFCAIVPLFVSLAAAVTFLTNRLLSYGLPGTRAILVIAFFLLAAASAARLPGLVMEKRRRIMQVADRTQS
jgi:hypothetical protein